MRATRLAATVALAAVVPFLAACGGGDNKNAAEPLPTTPTLTVPGSTKAPKVDNSASQTTTTETTTSATTTPTTTPATTQANPSTPQGGAAPPSTGGATPGGGQTTPSPSPSSPAGKFEQFCKENPGAC